MDNLNEIKELIENNPVALATVMADGQPNIIGVAFVKVVADNQLLVTDNYMKQTITDITSHQNVCLIVWDSNLCGHKIIGEAKYYTSGPWKDYVERMVENKGLPAKGAILIKVSKIIKSK